MNTYSFHINLYDLAFEGAIFVGLTFAMLLIFTKSINQAAKRFLGLALAIAVLWIIRILGIDVGIATYHPHWGRLPLQFSLAFGPFIFFYVLKLTLPERKFGWKNLLHFGPLLLQQGVVVLEIKESINTGAATYDTLIFKHLNPVLQLLAFISVSTYLYWSHGLIERFYQRLISLTGLATATCNELRWLYRLLTGFSLLWLLWILFNSLLP